MVWNVRLGSEHSGLEFWLNSIGCHAPLSPIFLIGKSFKKFYIVTEIILKNLNLGTHIDEVNKYELPIEKLKQRYPQIAGFYFVSSVSGAGINDLAKAIVDVALKEKYMVK